jgi:hypothetical protein
MGEPLFWLFFVLACPCLIKVKDKYAEDQMCAVITQLFFDVEYCV